MEADVYLAEHIIRERRAEAQARAELARLFGEASQCLVSSRCGARSQWASVLLRVQVARTAPLA